MDDPLEARDARRVDRMEKVVRELRSIVYQGRDSGKPVVVQPAETDFQIQALTQRVADLEQALTRVNAQLETATFESEQLRRQLQALEGQTKALADRLNAAEQASAPSEPQATAPPAPRVPPAEAFTAARQLMLNGDYDGSERAWRAYVSDYPEGPRLAEAQYWLGKTLSARSAHAEAAAAYIGAVRGWPQTSWGADATVELARELIALKKLPEACQALGELDRRYPKASSAIKSRAQVARGQAKCG